MADLTAQGYQPTDAPDLVNGDYKKMLADLQALNTQVGDMVQQVATLVSSDSTMSAEITALQQKNTAQDREIQSLQDSLSRKVSIDNSASKASIYCDNEYNQRVMVKVTDAENGDTYILIASNGYIGLYDATLLTWIWRKTMSGIE